MHKELRTSLRSFFIGRFIYAALVAAYYFLVLHFLGGWLAHWFHEERRLYAAMALVLIVGQGILLEIVTRSLMELLKPRAED